MMRKQLKWRKALAALLICGLIAPLPASAAGTAGSGIPNVSAAQEETVGTAAASQTNLSLSATASANGSEGDNLVASKAADGDSTTRWASLKQNGPHWLQLAWDTAQTVKGIRIHWERKNATSYKIQISETGADDSWQDVESFTEAPADYRQEIELGTAVQAKYLRLYIESFSETGAPEGGNSVTWNTISVYELETYEGGIPVSLENVAGSLVVDEVIETTEDRMQMPTVPEGVSISLIGADYEQIVDRDGTVYRPLVDKEVTVNFRLENTATEEVVESQAYTFTVKGTYTEEDGDNAKPAVLPEMAEWKGDTGNFTVTDTTKILVASKDRESLSYVAEEFQADFADITGRNLQIVYGEEAEAGAGDFFFELIAAGTGLKDEGYLMAIGDKVEVQAEKSAGIYWSTRSILQILKQNGDTIPKGTARDYPKYSVRGFMLDVARRPFSKKIIDEVIKTMAWYKMNDFHMHLNDNYIFLEDYENYERAMTAYEGFRLESSIKEGGADGLYKADLTSDDIYYTKDEMRSMIQNYRKLGVNIVPEIDTPAHSLSLTKVRPDLMLGTTNVVGDRQSEHLNLTEEKYDDSLAFVQQIFNEYFEGENPVFDRDTIINIGTDEYSADYPEEFRRFTDDMLGFAQENVKRVRLWGGLTARPGDTVVRHENVEMMHWSRDWVDAADMYSIGYKLIDILDRNVYIVPAASYYKDYLDKATIYNTYDPATVMGLPVGSEQTLGGSYAIWNDMVDKKANGLSEMEIFDRFRDISGFMAAKLWGEKTVEYAVALARREAIGEAPRTNAYDRVESSTDQILLYEFEDSLNDSSENGYHISRTEGTGVSGGRLHLEGGESWADTGLGKIGAWDSGKKLSFDVELTKPGRPGQILFESDAEYNTHDIRIMADGTLGFTREGYDYSFGYKLPLNKKVSLTIATKGQDTALYVDGSRFYEAVGSYSFEGDLKKDGITRAAMSLPVGRIGSAANAITGYIDNVSVSSFEGSGKAVNAIPSTGFQYTCDNENAGTAQNDNTIDKAFDDDSSTIWHTQWSPSRKDLPAEIIIDMGQPYSINGFYYQTRTGSTNGNITAYSLYYKDAAGEWQPLVENGTWTAEAGSKTVFFEPQTAQELKLVVEAGEGGFGSAAEFKILEGTEVPSTKVYLAAVAEAGGTASVSAAEVDAGTEVTFTASEEEGNSFAGWYDVTDEQVSTEKTYSIAATENMTLIAKFTKQSEQDRTVTVTIDGVPTTIPYGGTIAEPSDPVKPGHDFVGWIIEATGELFDFATPVTEDLTLTAKFTVKTLTVTMDGKAVKVEYGKTVAKPSDPVKAGHDFVGWIIEATGEQFDFAAPVTEDLTLTAKFTVKTLTVTMDGKAVKVAYGKTVAKPADPEKEGYRFIGWVVADTGKLYDFTAPVTEDLVLTAQFEEEAGEEMPWPFEDVKVIPSHWKYENVKFVYENGIMNGISGTKEFRPDGNVNRAMFATVLYRMAGEPAVTFTDRFKDVKDGQYYSAAVIWAESKKIVQGVGDGTNYGVLEDITREQIAKMLCEFGKVQGYDVSGRASLDSFTDKDKVGSWATGYMSWAVDASMISGKPNDAANTSFRLDPQGKATRAECAKMLAQFMQKYAGK